MRIPMRSSAYWLLAYLVVMALAGWSTAAAADDRETCAKQSGDVAIAACSRAIASGNFTDEELAAIYVSRGLEYKNERDPDRAIADYDQAIGIDPNNTRVYDDRAVAWAAKGDFDRAIADYDQAIRLDPKNAGAYLHRGIGHLYADALRNALSMALADLNRASALYPRSAEVVLWLDIVNKRSSLPSRLAEATKHVPMAWWPAPVIRLYLGELTPEALLAAADNPNLRAKQARICQANFFIGELALQWGKTDEAKRLFTLAAAGCPKDFAAYIGATAELEALGARP